MTKGNLPPHPAAGIMAEMMKEAEFKPPEINKCQIFILLLISINIYMKGERRSAQPIRLRQNTASEMSGMINSNTLSHH